MNMEAIQHLHSLTKQTNNTEQNAMIKFWSSINIER